MPDDLDTKTCPRCAEDVKAAAEVCRFCGHTFADSPRGRRRHRLITLGLVALAIALGAVLVVRANDKSKRDADHYVYCVEYPEDPTC